MKAEPILVFKKDRGKWLIATEVAEMITPELIYQPTEEITLHIYLFESWLDTKDSSIFKKERL
jgi:hypothetical protein